MEKRGVCPGENETPKEQTKEAAAKKDCGQDTVSKAAEEVAASIDKKTQDKKK